MDIILLFILLLLIVVYSYFHIGDNFSPWMLTTAVWFAILFLFQIENKYLDPLSDQFYYSLLLWLPIFIGSSLITFYAFPCVKNEENAILRILDMNKDVFTFLFVFSAVTTPLLLYQIMKIATQFDTTDLLYNIRILSVYGDEDYGFLNYSSVVNKALLVIALWRFPKIPIWQLIVIYIVNLLSCFAIMEKGGIFLMVSTTLFVLFEKKNIKTRSIFITGGFVLFFFFLMNIARSEQSANSGNETSFMDFFAMYILSPAVAFGRTTIDLTGQLGAHTFETVYLFLKRFGFDVKVYEKLQEFVWVPIPTNVYTIFQPFFQDFGYHGIAFFAFVYGTFSGWIYRLFRNGSGIGRCVYAYIVYALLLQFFQENIFLSIVAFIQYVFFLIITLQNKIIFAFFSKESNFSDKMK